MREDVLKERRGAERKMTGRERDKSGCAFERNKARSLAGQPICYCARKNTPLGQADGVKLVKLSRPGARAVCGCGGRPGMRDIAIFLLAARADRSPEEGALREKRDSHPTHPARNPPAVRSDLVRLPQQRFFPAHSKTVGMYRSRWFP